jgi:hypothetical protein
MEEVAMKVRITWTCPFIMRKEIDIKSNDDSNDIDVNLHPEKPTVRELQRRAQALPMIFCCLSLIGELQDALSRDILTQIYGEIFETIDISQGFINLRINDERLERWRTQIGTRQEEQDQQVSSRQHKGPTKEKDNVLSLVQVASLTVLPRQP